MRTILNEGGSKMREIDFSKTLFELVTEYPEVKQINHGRARI